MPSTVSPAPVFHTGPWHALLVLLTLLLAPATLLAMEPQQPLSNLIELGNERYQLGKIVIDREKQQFTVSGRLIRSESPLEYLVIKKGGMKAYESIFEADTTAKEFNLACIMIGLNSENATLPRFHFDPEPVRGDPVDVSIVWKDERGEHEVNAEDMFLVDGKPIAESDWAYTGSNLLPDGEYLAENVGTLVGFIHDADSIIEHRTGISIGSREEAKLNPDLIPALGIDVTIRVRHASERTQAAAATTK